MIRGRRLYRLDEWLIRALIPEHRIGTYLLYAGSKPVYAGRSDRNLRRRLIAHASWSCADHFGFEVYADADRAYDMECGLYHVLHYRMTNAIHPAAPAGSRRPCLICSHEQALADRELMRAAFVDTATAKSMGITPLLEVQALGRASRLFSSHRRDGSDDHLSNYED